MTAEDNIVEISLDSTKLLSLSDSLYVADRYNDAFKEISKNLTSLNTNRGGKSVSKTSGYVFENLYGYEKNIESIKNGSRQVFRVIDDNSKTDLIMIDIKGKKYRIQAKKGYKGSNKYKIVKNSGYKDIDLYVIDKGNKELKSFLEKNHLSVEEAKISNKKIEGLTRKMKKEREIYNKMGFNNTNAPITTNLFNIGIKLKAAHVTAVPSAVNSAALSAGMTIGKELYFLIQGDQDIKQFGINTAKNTIIAGAGTYGTSFATSLLAPLAFDALAKVTVFETAKNTIVQIGAFAAQVSIGMGPMFLFGLAVGCAYTGYKIIKLINDTNKKYIREINNYLSMVNETMNEMNVYLEQLSSYVISEEIATINNELKNMENAVTNNNIESVNTSIDRILNLFDKHVLFDTQESFDDFFYSDESFEL